MTQAARSHSTAGWDPALSLPAPQGKQTPVWQKMLCRTLMSTTWRLLLRRELGVAWKLTFNNCQRKKKRRFFLLSVLKQEFTSVLKCCKELQHGVSQLLLRGRASRGSELCWGRARGDAPPRQDKTAEEEPCRYTGKPCLLRQASLSAKEVFSQ